MSKKIKPRFKYPSHTRDGEPVPYTVTMVPTDRHERSMPVKGYRIQKEGQLSNVMMKWSAACRLIRALGADRIVPVVGYKN